ncbi:hypothetical protein OC861_006812 [Tilletia horrida]|nr:hypothetical protein OC861_006812 [Tilletia horrida]
MDETDPASILSMNDPSAVATASAKASSAAERADKLANTRLLRRDREGSILLGHDEEVAPTCSTPDIEGVNHYQHAAYGGLLIIVSGYKLSHLSADFGVRIDDDDGISRRTSTSKVTQKFGAAMSAQFVVPSSDDEEDRMSWGGTYSAAPGLHEETPAFAANHEMLTARQNLPHTFPSPLHHPEPNILLSGHGRPPSPMSRPEALRTFVSAYEAMGRATRLLAEASAVLNDAYEHIFSNRWTYGDVVHPGAPSLCLGRPSGEGQPTGFTTQGTTTFSRGHHSALPALDRIHGGRTKKDGNAGTAIAQRRTNGAEASSATETSYVRSAIQRNDADFCLRTK